MSEKNHPNFHACQFACDIMASYFECLRGGTSLENCPDIRQEVIDFVAKIEEKVDKKVGI